MKLLIALLLLTNTSLITPTTAIPDIHFEQTLINLGIDKDKQINGLIDNSAILSITELDLSNKGIIDLSGIEAFVNLTYLNCSKNDLERLDISSLEKLEKLNCSDNEMQLLDCSNNVNLKFLACNKNQLQNLDLSKNRQLTKVFCSNNKLDELSLHYSSLQYLDCNNNNLRELSLETASNLEKLYCSNNKLETLDLSNSKKLLRIDCKYNNLHSLNLQNGNNKYLEVVNVSKNLPLSCIAIDDVSSDMPKTWYKEEFTQFSNSCSKSVNVITFDEILIE